VSAAGDSAVAAVEETAQDGEDGNEVERVGPPDAAEEVTVDVGAVEAPAVGQEQPDIIQQVGRRTERLPHPFGLERRSLNSPPPEDASGGADPAPAKLTRIVVQQPTTSLHELQAITRSRRVAERKTVGTSLCVSP
jgi:hypothetical protein